MKIKKQNVRFWHVMRFGLFVCFVFVLIGGFVSCKEEYTYKDPRVGGTPYDPNKPVEVTALMPDSGGYRTQFVIKGSNFGTDPSKIKVTFNGNRLATVVSSNGEVLYGIVPKQADGKNHVTVSVDGKDDVVAPQTFRYTRVQQVSTVSGMAGGGYVDGKLIDAKFNYMIGCGIVTGNNLIVAERQEGKHVRMISADEDKVTTLLTGVVFGQPAITKNRTCAYFVQRESPHALYSFSQDKSWASTRLASSLQYKDASGNLQNFGGDIYSCTLDEQEKYIYFRDATGKLGRVSVEHPSEVELVNASCGNAVGSIAYLAWNPVDKHFFLTVQEENGMYRISADGQTVEQYAGFNYTGGADGPRLNGAQMHKPGAITFDADGNIYFTSTNGHTIRMVSLADGMVSTVAGKYLANEYADGLPLDARFSFPYGICADDEYNFYIVEGWGTKVRKLAIE